jgi:hypothetical protein
MVNIAAGPCSRWFVSKNAAITSPNPVQPVAASVGVRARRQPRQVELRTKHRRDRQRDKDPGACPTRAIKERHSTHRKSDLGFMSMSG